MKTFKDKIVISANAPTQKGCIWAKPLEGSYALYIWDKGGWQLVNPIKYDSDGVLDVAGEKVTVIDTSAYQTTLGKGTYSNRPDGMSEQYIGTPYWCTDLYGNSGGMIFFNGHKSTDGGDVEVWTDVNGVEVYENKVVKNATIMVGTTANMPTSYTEEANYYPNMYVGMPYYATDITLENSEVSGGLLFYAGLNSEDEDIWADAQGKIVWTV